MLPAVVALFQQRHPGIALSLQIGSSAVIEERIRGNEIDLGVVGGHALHPGEECLASGLHDELVLIVPADHLWARRREIPPALLANQRLLVREEGSATRQVAERALQHACMSVGASMELGHTGLRSPWACGPRAGQLSGFNAMQPNWPSMPVMARRWVISRRSSPSWYRSGPRAASNRTRSAR